MKFDKIRSNIEDKKQADKICICIQENCNKERTYEQIDNARIYYTIKCFHNNIIIHYPILVKFSEYMMNITCKFRHLICICIMNICNNLCSDGRYSWASLFIKSCLVIRKTTTMDAFRNCDLKT